MKDTSTIYIHDKPASFKSQLLKSVMVLVGWKKNFMKGLGRGKYPNPPARITKSILKKFKVDATVQDGRNIWTISSKKNIPDTIILYLHGGSYVGNIRSFHWNMIEELAKKTNSSIVLPDYPLAPTATYKDVYNFVHKLYTRINTESISKKIIIVGDSAGAGLALGFLQYLRNENISQPEQILLISPWLDITMSNSDINKIDKKDKMLGINGLKMAGQAYAGTLDKKDYRVSPIYGDFKNLCKISIFIGTHDVLIADCRKLKQNMEEEKIAINYFEYPKMFHDWVVITGLKESQYAIEQMTNLITGEK